MKKKIVTLLLTGLVGMVLMGFRTPSTEPIGGGNHDITYIKGSAFDQNQDGYYELITFGLLKFNPARYAVAFIQLDGPDGAIGEILLPQGEKADNVYWYAVNVSGFRIPVMDGKNEYQFSATVRVVSQQWLKFNTDFSGSKALNSNGAPNDPEETILIVRYP